MIKNKKKIKSLLTTYPFERGIQLAKNNKNNKKIESIQKKLENGELTKNEDALFINNPDYFLTFSDLEISDGIDIIENIMVLSNNYISFNRQNESEPLTDVELMEITEEYKEKLSKALNKFLESYNELKELFEDDDNDCNDYICNDYPFEKSFDEYAISDWVYATEENLKKGKK